MTRDPARETAFERLGGEANLRALIGDFIDRVFDDVMIGFFFLNADRKRIKEMEYQLAARYLGAPVRYEGRPLREAHAKHPIMGGQFMRRQKILEETLTDHGAPADIRDDWLAHNESMRHLITSDAGSDCDEVEATKRVGASVIDEDTP